MAKKESGPSFESILLSLKQGRFEPVYFLCGEEPYFIDEISSFIEKHALQEHEKEFNFSVLYGRDVDIPTLAAACRRFPMMAERQVVILREGQENRKIEDLASYIENPVKSTILVICYKNKKPDGRGKFAGLLKKNSVYLETTRLYDNQLPGWITKFAESKGYKIKDVAAQLLADNIGNDLASLAGAIEKLSILLPAGAEITTALIEENIGISKDFNVFELQKAIGDKDIYKANQIANYFAANPKNYPLVLTVGLLSSFFMKIVMFHYLPDKSKMPASAALKINPFFYSDYLTAARNYPAGKAVRVMEYLRDYDLRAKGLGASGDVSEGEHLRELLFKILH